jgi:hypothetical protein
MVDLCPACGWCAEIPQCHVEHAPGCPHVRAMFEVTFDEDGLQWRRRDFLWLVVRVLAWRSRAVRRCWAPPEGLGFRSLLASYADGFEPLAHVPRM